jgi:hypothetical protein
MADSDGEASPINPQSWREISEQLSQEDDNERIQLLYQELMRAFEMEDAAQRNAA